MCLPNSHEPSLSPSEGEVQPAQAKKPRTTEGSAGSFIPSGETQAVRPGRRAGFRWLQAAALFYNASMKFRKQAQCVYYTRYHIVFVTKYRKKALKAGMGSFCVGILRRICMNYPDLELHEAKTDEDHLHFLISIPPKWQISHAINIIKSNTSRAMRRRFPFLNKLYDRHLGFWSDGYFLSTVGVDELTIKNYIQYQGEEDSGQAKLEF